MNANGLAQDPNAVDVSQPETHFQVQCSDIRLISSLLKPAELPEEEKDLEQSPLSSELMAASRTKRHFQPSKWKSSRSIRMKMAISTHTSCAF